MKTSSVIEFFGSQAEVARKLGIGRAAVSKWGETVPPLRALQIEEVTGGALKANRAEIFGPAPVDTLPEDADA